MSGRIAGTSLASRACAALVIAAAGAAPAPALDLVARAGFERQEWRWESYRGSFRATQVRLPVDLSLRAGSTRVAVGYDRGWSDLEAPGGRTELSSPSGVRGACERGFARDRLRVGLGLERELGGGGLTEREAALARVLEEVALRWSRPPSEGGLRFRFQSTVRLVGRESFLLHAGAGREWRGRGEITEAGRELDPGGRTRAGAAAIARIGPVRQELAAHGEWPGRSRVVGGWGYEPGAQYALRARSELGSVLGRLGGDLRILIRDGGRVDAGSPLDAVAVRGGNAVRGGLDLARGLGSGEWELALAGVGVRGLPGDLGHAQWFETQAAWSRPLSAARVRLSLGLRRGSCRGGRDLRGSSVSFSVSGAAR